MSLAPIAGLVVVVTGASSGIGHAAARQFARAGARVVLAARRASQLEELAREIATYPAEAIAVPTDVTRDDHVARMVEAALSRFGRIDMLICNAGVGLHGDFKDVPIEAVRQAFEVNFFGTARCIQSVLPSMLARGSGLVQIVSSVIGKRSIPGASGYCATKFALGALAESLRVELDGTGVVVQTVYPALTDTEFARSSIIRNPAPGPARLRAMPADAVARIMVRAARKRSRDTVVSAAGRALVLLNAVAPGLVDSILAQVMVHGPRHRGRGHALPHRRQ